MPTTRLIVALLLVASVAAQPPTLKDVHRVMPAFGVILGDVYAVGDVTGDGILDIVLAGWVWAGSADGVFTDVASAFPQQHIQQCRSMILVDVDGDTDLDCVTANEQSISWLPIILDIVYFNDGSGRFQTNAALPGWSGTSTSVDAADIDNDGDQDLIFGRRSMPLSQYPRNLLYLNDGSGAFTLDQTRLPLDQDETNTIAFLDFDGDGDQDLYAGNDSAYGLHLDKLYANDGQGFFTAVPLGGNLANDTIEVHAADFDLDGDPDLLTWERTQSGVQGLRYRENDGAGVFSVAAFLPPVVHPISQILLGDWNGDGRTDYGLRAYDTVHVFRSVGQGQFRPDALPPVVIGNRLTLVIDYDDDGDSDLVAPSDQLTPFAEALDTWLLRNTGTSWTPLPPTPLPSIAPATAPRHLLADVNGDDHLDLIVGPDGSHGGRVLLGSGTAAFTEVASGDFGLETNPCGLALGDVDGDGDVDIVCITANTGQLFRNQNGSFLSGPLLPFTGRQIALADLDGDGDLDAVLDGSGLDFVLLNDGMGNFQWSPGALPMVDCLSTPLHLADFTGDGHVDIALYSNPYPAECGILVNSGTATFAAVPMPGLQPFCSSSYTSGQSIAADFDGDADVDLFLEGLGNGAPHRLLSNDGAGSFSIQSIPSTGSATTRRLIAADLDVDGLPDIIEADFASSRILHNTGLGFAPVPNADFDLSSFRQGSVGDVDEDGDPDLLVTSWQSTFLLYRNLFHQLAWRSLPRVGYPLQLDLFGRANEPYVLAFTLWPANLPIPGFGTLHLDPATLQILIFAGYDPDGHAEFTAPVPNVPGLLGLSIYWQVLSSSPTRLGNVEIATLQAH